MQAPARRKRTGTGASRTPADVRSRPARETAARGADGAGAISLVGEGVVGDGEDKWQGGVLGDDGNIYGIPERGHRVLKIEPGAAATAGPPRGADILAP